MTRNLACLLLVTLLAGPALAEDEAPKPKIPDGLVGFAGQVVGTVVSKHEHGFVLRDVEIARSWKHSKAKRPESAEGERLLINVRWEREGGEWRPAPRQMRWKKNVLRVGQRVTVDVANKEGQRLHLMELDEEQRKAEARSREKGEEHAKRDGKEREHHREGEKGEEHAKRDGKEREHHREGEKGEEHAKRDGKEREHHREGEKGEARKGKLPQPELPEGFRGFSGTVAGFAVNVKEGEVLFLVAAIKNTWKDNRAKHPRSVIWRAVRITARVEDGRAAPRHMAWISTLKPGEDYAIEVKNTKGNELFVLELNERQRRAADRALDRN